MRNETFAVAGSNNYASDATCTGSNFTTGNPQLTPLTNAASDDVKVQVHEPAVGSPLLDTIPNCGLAID